MESRFLPIGSSPEGMLFRIMLWLRPALHRTGEKGRKDCAIAANIFAIKAVRLRSIRHRVEGNIMGETGKKRELPKKVGLPGKADGKSNKPPPAVTEDDDDEDGDIATPKRDRYGEDDQPL
jgi:hypothetical protein